MSDLTYQLARCVLSVTGSTWWRWDLALQRPVTEPIAFSAKVLQIADRRSERRMNISPNSHWANLDCEIALSPDGRLVSVNRSSDGRADESVLAVIQGFMAGISPGQPKAAAAKTGSPEAGDRPHTAEAAEGSGPEADAGAGASSTPAAPAEDDGDEGATPEANGDRSTETTPTAGADDPFNAGAPKEPQTPTAPSPSPSAPAGDPTWIPDSVWEAYAAANPGRAGVSTTLRAALKTLTAEFANPAATLDSRTKILTLLDTATEALSTADDEFLAWVHYMSQGRRVDLNYDLELWDLPLDAHFASWKSAHGRQAIARALHDADRSVRPAGSPTRRSGPEAVDATFHQLGLVFAVVGLDRAGDDTDGSGIPDQSDNEEPIEIDPKVFEGLKYRQPYHVTLACYRLTPGSDGTEVLELVEHRSVPVVTELSAVRELSFSDQAIGKTHYEIELSDFGAPAHLATETESERAAAVTLAGKVLEQISPALFPAVGGAITGGLNILQPRDIVDRASFVFRNADRMAEVTMPLDSHDNEVEALFASLRRGPGSRPA